MSRRARSFLGLLLLAAVLISGAGCFSWDSSGSSNDRAPRESGVAHIDDVAE